MRHLVREYPATEVLTEAPSLTTISEGSTVVLCLRKIDADWLNLERPGVQARALRLVLFSDEATTVHLAREAVDFYDWISHSIECPPGPPAFAVRAFRHAVCARAVAIVWEGGDLEGTFAEALPGRKLTRVTADQPYAALLEPLKSRAQTWVEVTGLGTSTAIQRIIWAEAEVKRRGRLVLVEPGVAPPAFPRVGARALTIEEGAARLREAGIEDAARLAALIELSPRAIDDTAKLARAGVGEAELSRLALSEADPGAALGHLAEKLRREEGREAPPVDEEPSTDARGRFNLPSWPARVELAYREDDLEVASHWATGWRAAGGGARAIAALVRVRVESSTDEARALLLEAKREAGDDPDEATRFELIRAEGLFHLFNGDSANAARMLAEALKRAEKLDRDFLDRAEIYEGLMQSLTAADRLDQAEQLWRSWTSKLAISENVLTHALVDRAGVRLKIAQGDIKGAEQLIKQWRDIWDDKDSPVAPTTDHLSAHVLLTQERFAEAESSLRQAIKRYAHLGRSASSFRQQYAQALQGLGRFPEAEKELRGLLAEKALGSTDVAVTRHALASCIAAQGRIDESEALLDTCLTDLYSNGHEDSRTYVAVLHDKARTRALKSDLPGAEVLLRQVLPREEAFYGRDNRKLLITLSELSETLIRLHKPKEAEPFLRRAVRLSKQVSDPSARASALALLAAAQAAQGFQHARSTARQSLEAWTATGIEVPPVRLRELEAIAAGVGLPPSTSSRRHR